MNAREKAIDALEASRFMITRMTPTRDEKHRTMEQIDHALVELEALAALREDRWVQTVDRVPGDTIGGRRFSVRGTAIWSVSQQRFIQLVPYEWRELSTSPEASD